MAAAEPSWITEHCNARGDYVLPVMRLGVAVIQGSAVDWLPWVPDWFSDALLRLSHEMEDRIGAGKDPLDPPDQVVFLPAPDTIIRVMKIPHLPECGYVSAWPTPEEIRGRRTP